MLFKFGLLKIDCYVWLFLFKVSLIGLKFNGFVYLLNK